MITGVGVSPRPATEGSEVNCMVTARSAAAKRNPVCEAIAEHEAVDSQGVTDCH